MKKPVSGVRWAVVCSLALITLAALAIAAFMFSQTPETNRGGEPAMFAAVTAVILAFTLLCIVGGKACIEAVSQLIERLVK